MSADDPDPRANHPRGIDLAATREVIDWLTEQGLRKTAPHTVLAGLSERLVRRGVPLDRSLVAMQTLHPTVDATLFEWDAATTAGRSEVEHSNNETEAWLRSPMRHMLVNDVWTLRRRLTGPEAVLDFPVLEEFQGQGFTDYYARLYGFPIRDGATPDGGAIMTGAISRWLTRRPDGFRDPDLALIDQLLPALTLAVQASLDREIAVNLLDAYVGPVAGRRILSGEIHRGSAESIDAALMITDLSDFTAVTDATPLAETVATLNRYFDAMVGPVVDEGGQILKFLGDGFLAIFPTGPDGPAAPAVAAFAAARGALAACADLNATRAAAGDRPMALNVALHAGEVMFGNIGARDRLDFTVIGRAVNEASRMEALCKRLGLALIASEAVATHLPRGSLADVGAHPLRGVSGSRRLFGLAR